MNERGTYGRQSLTNGYGRPQGFPMWNAPPPMVGVAPGMKRAAAEIGLDVFMTVAFTFMGSWLGGKATPKEPTKGNIIGGATGYFASLLVKQNSALARIADHTRDLQR